MPAAAIAAAAWSCVENILQELQVTSAPRAVKVSIKHPLGGFGDKYNVVPMSTFEKKDEYDLDGIYIVKFGQGKFSAKLLFIGMYINLNSIKF